MTSYRAWKADVDGLSLSSAKRFSSPSDRESLNLSVESQCAECGFRSPLSPVTIFSDICDVLATSTAVNFKLAMKRSAAAQ